jgi:putative nucleotidyltransferase with HDIG domain
LPSKGAPPAGLKTSGCNSAEQSITEYLGLGECGDGRESDMGIGDIMAGTRFRAWPAPEKFFLAMRVLSIPGVALWWLFEPDRDALAPAIGMLLAVFAVYSALIYLGIFMFPDSVRSFYAGAVFLDLFILSFLTQVSGDNHSVFQVGFLLVVVLTSYYFGIGMGVLVAVVSSLMTIIVAVGIAGLGSGDAIISIPRLDLLALRLGDYGMLLGFKLLVVLGIYELQRAQATQHEKTKELADALQIRTDQLGEAHLQIIASWSAAVDAKDPYTERHSERVARWAGAVAHAMNMSNEEVEDVYRAALLHDVGKISVADGVLKKRGPLTYDQWLNVQEHASVGAELVSKVSILQRLRPAILHHHERGDGSGYPNGLTLDEIPLASRIIAVADSYDAMTSKRPYRVAKDVDEALEELRQLSGTKYDAEVVNAFLRVMNAERRPTPVRQRQLPMISRDNTEGEVGPTLGGSTVSELELA